MQEFMFIYKGGDPSWQKAPLEQKQAAQAAWGEWLAALGARGQLVSGGSPLDYDGRRVSAEGVITDIAASELKELVSGYSIIKANDYAEAAQLAKGCPIFRVKGAFIEVRALSQM